MITETAAQLVASGLNYQNADYAGAVSIIRLI
jgi:hypothetical protein